MSNDHNEPDESERIAGFAARAVLVPKTLLLGGSDPLRESSRTNPPGKNDYAPDTSTPSGKSPWRVFRSPVFWVIFFLLIGLSLVGLFRGQ